jgi:hypothetical protein
VAIYSFLEHIDVAIYYFSNITSPRSTALPPQEHRIAAPIAPGAPHRRQTRQHHGRCQVRVV